MERKAQTAMIRTLPSRTFRPVAFLLAATAALGVVSPASGVPDYRRRERQEAARALEPILKAPEPAGRVIAHLRSIEDAEKLELALVALAEAMQSAGSYAVAETAFDRLVAAGDARSAVLGADVLLKSIDVVKLSAYGASKEIRGYPDALCERAASLLDHPDPVVQAMGEWALALRVKKHDATNKKLPQLYLGREDPPAWYRAWKARGRERHLRDDYARQLVQLNRHRTAGAVGEAVEAVAARIEALAADPASRPAERQLEAFGEALASARQAVAAGDLPGAHAAYLALRQAARGAIAAARGEFPAEGMVFFTNPAIPGGVWNVNVAVTGRTNIPVGELYVKRSADPAAPARALLNGAIGAGSIRGIDLDWQGDRVVLSFWHQPLTGKPPFGWDYKKNAFLYELSLSGGEPKPLTGSPGSNDIEPCILPDGGIVFASDRSSFGNQCAGPFLQNKRCTTLYRLDGDRAAEPVAISNNKDFDRHPHVLHDGMVVFLHWEYQERDLYNLHTAWRCRPDGTNMDAFYKQHISRPYSIRDVQQAPGSDLCVATVQGHHDGHNGPVILFDPSRGINNTEAMWLLTPGASSIEGGLGPLRDQVVAPGGVRNRGGSYINPFPMSENCFLVGHDMTANESEFALYYIDVWGNRELLHRDANVSCFMPHPLRKRTRPPVVADQVDPKATHATAFVEDVYRDLPGVPRGAVKYLRISQRLMLPAPVDYDDPDYRHNHLHYLPGDATTRHFAHWTWAPTRTVGIVDVEANGSAYFKVPAGTPVFLQALDANHCEIRRMRTSFTLQRGEFRGCTGCHESRMETVALRNAYRPEVLQRGPQTPVPPAWGDTTVLDYRRDIQAIFDKHCTACHGKNEPKGGIELTSREIGGFPQSYRTLFGLKPGDPTPIKALDWHLELHPEARGDKFIHGRDADPILRRMQRNDWPGMLVSISDRHSEAEITMPYQFGTNRSKLIRTLLDHPQHREKVRGKLSDVEWLKLVTWIDHNAVYHSTVIDVSKYRSQKTLTRVRYVLPSPWQPADLNPPFYNRADTSAPPAAAGR